ncbi:MAG: sulfite exporter TauE/SafE family protein [Bacteroidota bacterium]
MEILGYLFSVLIGISIGLIGAGGSILAVPILVYLFSVNPQLATTYSLFIVGATAFFGAIRHYQMGNLKFRLALSFALPSVVSLLVVRKYILPIIPDQILSFGNFSLTKSMLLMLVFAVLMILASLSMIKSSGEKSIDGSKQSLTKLMIIGFGVGMVTGFLGAGGGFLIIPALVLFSALPMKQAIGTSLLIIFLNSFIGFAGDIINEVQLDYSLLISVTLIAIAGMLIGVQLSKKISGAKLKPGFGWFVLIMGLYIIAKELLLK